MHSIWDHIGDDLVRIGALNLPETGVYQRLKLHYAHTEKPLPPDRVHRIACAYSAPDRAAVDAVLQQLFVLTDAGWVLPWVTEEIAKVRAKSAKACASASARWSKQDASESRSDGDATATESHSDGNAVAMRTHCDGNANQKPETRNQEPEQCFGATKDQGYIPPSARSRRRKPANDQGKMDQTTLAIAAYNEHLTKPPHNLPRATKVGITAKRDWVRRSADTARDICQSLYGNPRVTAEFWGQYFGQVTADPFRSGLSRPGVGHESWRPDFEYLVKPKTMMKVFELSGAADDSDCPGGTSDRDQGDHDDTSHRAPDAGVGASTLPVAAVPAPPVPAATAAPVPRTTAPVSQPTAAPEPKQPAGTFDRLPLAECEV